MLNLKKFNGKLSQTTFKVYQRIFSTRQFNVNPFCNIKIDCSCNINVEPLDVFKYPNCDQVLVSVSNKTDALNYEQNGDEISIKMIENKNNMSCSIAAPVKANLNIANAKNVHLSNFNSERILINASNNINIDKCYGNTIFVNTIHGNITSNSVLQAGDIVLQTENGNIKTGKLQGLALKIKTKNGNITTDSTYCERSHVEVDEGNIFLNNPHKNLVVRINTKGNLNLVGLDGTVQAFVENGDMNLEISRLLADSRVAINQGGNLHIKLNEICQENTTLEIISNECTLDEDVNANLHKFGDTVQIMSKQNVDNCMKLLIDCKQAKVRIGSLTWFNMFAKQLENSQNK